MSATIRRHCFHKTLENKVRTIDQSTHIFIGNNCLLTDSRN